MEKLIKTKHFRNGKQKLTVTISRKFNEILNNDFLSLSFVLDGKTESLTCYLSSEEYLKEWIETLDFLKSMVNVRFLAHSYSITGE